MAAHIDWCSHGLPVLTITHIEIKFYGFCVALPWEPRSRALFAHARTCYTATHMDAHRHCHAHACTGLPLPTWIPQCHWHPHACTFLPLGTSMRMFAGTHRQGRVYRYPNYFTCLHVPTCMHGVHRYIHKGTHSCMHAHGRTHLDTMDVCSTLHKYEFVHADRENCVCARYTGARKECATLIPAPPLHGFSTVWSPHSLFHIMYMLSFVAFTRLCSAHHARCRGLLLRYFLRCFTVTTILTPIMVRIVHLAQQALGRGITQCAYN
jgi:hypothetical protein